MAVALHVGGIGHEQTRPLGAHELGNAFQIRGNAAHGRGIELEVPGMDHAAHRRFHAQREAFGDEMYRLGAEVLYESVRSIHASGHAHREELVEMLHTVNPDIFVPVHGEYRHLVKHGRLAVEEGVPRENVVVLEDGHPITLLPDGFRLEPALSVECTLVDGKGVGDVGTAVLRERRILGDEGMVVVVLVLDSETGSVLHGPEMFSKGFVFEQRYSHVLEDAKCLVLDEIEAVRPGQLTRLQDGIRSSLRRFFRRVLERDPVVVPVVTEI